jgi:hypothetical protein
MRLRSIGVIASLAKRKIVVTHPTACLAPDVHKPTNTRTMVFSASIGAIMAGRAGPALADCHTPPTTSSTTEMTEDFPTLVRPLCISNL